MPAEIVHKQIDPALRQVAVVLMDDYGTTLTLQIDAAHALLYSQMLAEAQQAMADRQAQTEAMAAAVGLPLDPPLTVAAKLTRWAASTAPPGVSTVTVTLADQRLADLQKADAHA